MLRWPPRLDRTSKQTVSVHGRIMGISTHLHIIDDESAALLQRMSDESIRDVKTMLMEGPQMKWDNTMNEKPVGFALPVACVVYSIAKEEGIADLPAHAPDMREHRTFEWVDLDCAGAAVNYMACELIADGNDGGSDGWNEMLEGVVTQTFVGTCPRLNTFRCCLQGLVPRVEIGEDVGYGPGYFVSSAHTANLHSHLGDVTEEQFHSRFTPDDDSWPGKDGMGGLRRVDESEREYVLNQFRRLQKLVAIAAEANRGLFLIMH